MGQSLHGVGIVKREPVEVSNRAGRGRFMIVCEHASNWLPPDLGTLGLAPADMTRHIAWDPGALPVARTLAARLDAPLIASRVSRLAIDCNRPVDALDLIPELSETTVIPGNIGLPATERASRLALSHSPFHEALAALIDERLAAGLSCAIVTIHSFTPVYKSAPRPWHVGIIHDEDDRMALPMLEGLSLLAGITVGANEPYSPADRVYYTLERHARPRGLACAMVEIRNDEIVDEDGQRKWADRLAAVLETIDQMSLVASSSVAVETGKSKMTGAQRG